MSENITLKKINVLVFDRACLDGEIENNTSVRVDMDFLFEC